MATYKTGRMLAIIVLAGALLMSACQQSLSTPPASTPTAMVNPFVSPFPSVENPMEMIEQFAKGTATAAAQTAQAAATSGTPLANETTIPLTPGMEVNGTPAAPGTPTNANATAMVIVTPTLSISTPIFTPGGPIPTAGPHPTTYTLQKGEFPYCIARRFNVNPEELLTLNGLSAGDVYYPNLTLRIPQTGNPFPGERALHAHPDTFTVGVTSNADTIYGVACYYGDVEPAAIAQANGIPLSATLTPGQQLNIP